MLHSFLVALFPDSAQQAQYEAVRAVLQVEAGDLPVVLLGNFEVAGEVLDAVVVRPRSITVLLLVPQGGLLDVATPPDSTWQLDDFTLQDDSHAANPFEQFLRQQEALASWLGVGEPLQTTPIQPECITGLVVFGEPVRFGPGVENYLRRQPGTENFQLLSGDLAQLPRRLRQLTHPDLNLQPEALLNWTQELTEQLAAAATEPTEQPAADTDSSYWERKARQLWRWLGAEDVPPDAFYGDAPIDPAAASREEKRRLEHIRQQVREELSQQRQEMEAREAERERTIAQLQVQLNQAPSAAAEAAALQARLAVETREKAALEAAVEASRAEAAARNQELDTRIQQLGQLVEKLQSRPATPPPSPAAARVPAASARPTAGNPVATKPAANKPAAGKPAISKAATNRVAQQPSTWRLQWPRVAVIAAAVGGLGLGVWGLAQVSGKLWGNEATEQTGAASRSAANEEAAAQAPSLTDIQPDTIVVSEETNQEEHGEESGSEEPSAAQAAAADSFLRRSAQPVLTDSVMQETQAPDEE